MTAASAEHTMSPPPSYAMQTAITNAPEASRPKVLVSSSAVGYYGASQSASFTEDSPAGGDYLAEICTEWEAAAKRVPNGTRCVIIRTGIVLARDGGVLARMMPIFELFAGMLTNLLHHVPPCEGARG